MKKYVENRVSNVRSIDKYKRKRKVVYIIQIAFLLAVIIFVGFKTGIGSEIFIRTTVVTSGTLEQDILLEGLVIRDEKLITAPENGVFFPEVSEGSRIREGQFIGNFKKYSNDTEIIKADSAGLISYKTDSYENDFQIDNYEGLKADELFDINSAYEAVESGDEIPKGFPIARIVNNHKPAVIIIKVEKEVFDIINSQDKNTLRVKLNESESATASISSMIAKQNLVVLEIERWENFLLYKRVCNLRTVIATYSGFIIPSSSLIEREGESGAFVRSSGRFHWTSVDIIYEANDKAVVEGINGEKTEIITNPRIFNLLKSI